MDGLWEPPGTGTLLAASNRQRFEIPPPSPPSHTGNPFPTTHTSNTRLGVLGGGGVLGTSLHGKETAAGRCTKGEGEARGDPRPRTSVLFVAQGTPHTVAVLRDGRGGVRGFGTA